MSSLELIAHRFEDFLEGLVNLYLILISTKPGKDHVAGVHVMAYRQEELVAQIIDDAGLLPRPRRTKQSTN